jgi:hypothetical protein
VSNEEIKNRKYSSENGIKRKGILKGGAQAEESGIRS